MIRCNIWIELQKIFCNIVKLCNIPLNSNIKYSMYDHSKNPVLQHCIKYCLSNNDIMQPIIVLQVQNDRFLMSRYEPIIRVSQMHVLRMLLFLYYCCNCNSSEILRPYGKVDLGNTERVRNDETNIIRLMQFATFLLVHKKEPFFLLKKTLH